MEPDKGIEKVRKARKEISARNDFNVHKLIQFYKKKQQQHKDRLITKIDSPPRR